MAAPKLRFKEFDGEWCFRKIGDISECIVPGRNKPKLFDGDIPWVTTPDLKDKTYVSDTRSNYYISEEEAKSVGSKIVPTNSVIMSCVGDLGLFAINTKPIVINQQLHAFILDDHKYSSIFVLNALSKNQDYIEKVATKTALPYLNKDNCNSIPLFLCSFKEQTKIAAFLSVVDEKISQLNQKHQLLSQYKQGIIQKLFSQQLRFKADDGSEFGEWEQVKFGDLVDLISGFAFKSDYFAEDGRKLITPKNFTTTGKTNFTDINTKWTTEEIDEKYICYPNDLLVLLTDLTQSCELLGKPVLLSQDNGNVLLNQRIVKVIPRQKVQKSFLLYLLLTDSYHELIVSTASGTTVKHSSNNVLKSYTFNLPCLEEQTKIANFLVAIDQKIEVVAHQLEQAKQWKNGLLQQMFV